VARFTDLGISKGWWLYFELRCATGTPEFKAQLKSEIMALIVEEEGSRIVYGEDDKESKRIPVRSLRG
jgi:hypothetical protein